jgi:transcriptional regulator with PAS, ATPase and Fis domain
VLITGDNGTGKDVVASEVHRLSLRRRGKLVSIDIGCIPENLFEAELFGYEKGAFTGATTSKPGRIEEAEGGTLFLDEIGNLSLMLQQKLLTVIEKRTFTRVGSNKERNVDVRVISATNANLKEMVKNGTFRKDLYYRLNTIELQVPPLKERSNDILLLANYFLKKYIVKYNGEQQELSEDDNRKLLTYNWPGNVRELQHLMERRAIDAEYPLPANETEEIEEAAMVEELPLNLEELERQAIMKAVRQSDGNLTQAALLLGITRFTLYRKLEKLGKQ